MIFIRSIFSGIFIIVCFAISTLHCNVKSQPANKYLLFEKIDLDFPGLEKVKNAVSNGDYSSAITAYAQFKRNMDYPFPASSGLPSKYPSTKRRPADDRVELTMQNIFKSQGYVYQFPGEIDWHFNPTDKRQNDNYEGEYKREWVVMLNRMGWLRHLSSAFQKTGNPIYVQKIDALVNHWIAHNPVEVPDKKSRWVSGWRTLEAGKRVGSSWAESWVKTIQCPELQDSTIFNWAGSWVEHGEYLEQHSGTLNWLTDESKGLYAIGVLFPEFKAAKHWKELAVSRLLGQLETDFYPDGAQLELSPHYHHLTAESFVEVLQLSQLSGSDISSDFISKIENQFDYLLNISMPDRQLPRLNDSSKENIIKILEGSASHAFPQRDDYTWFVTSGKQGSPPPYSSVLLPWAGQAVMRNDWSEDANYLLFEYGPYGSGTHQHEDKLGVHIAAYGKTFVFEAGKENYGRSNLRKYSVGSSAHSVITIDGQGQNRKSVSPQLDVAKEINNANWVSNPIFDYATENYGKSYLERYGKKNVNLGIWRRHVLFLKPDIFLIIDFMNPNDDGVHTYHSHFHLNTDNANINHENYSVSIVEKGQPSFLISPLLSEGLSAKIIKGQTDPYYLGWELFSKEDDRAIPTLRYEIKSAGKVAFAYAFKGVPAGRPVPNLKLTEINNLPPDLFGVVLNGDVGKVGSVKIILSKKANNNIRYLDTEYDTEGLLIFENANRKFDLGSGKEIN